MQKHGRKTSVRRRIAQSVALLLVTPLLAVLASTTPAAASIPTTNFTATLSDVPRVQHSLTQADGGITVGCSSTGATGFKSFSASGSVTQSVAKPDGIDQQLCSNESAIGSDGTMFVHATGIAYWQHVIKAYKNGVELWSYLPASCSFTTVQAMTIGTNGNVYFVVWGGSCGTRLIGVTPTAPGTTTPTEVLNVSVSMPVAGGLAAYNGGLVVYGGNYLKYITYGGSDTTISLNGVAIYQETFDATTTGTVFIPLAADSSTRQACNDYSVIASVAAYKAGIYQWSYMPPACARSYEIRPTPDGGFVAHFFLPVGGTPGVNYHHLLYAVGPTGVERWHLDVGAEAGMDSLAPLYSVDLNGNVALQQGVRYGVDVNGSHYQFPALRFKLIEGASGAVFNTVELSGDTGTTSGPSYQWTDDYQPRIARNTWYATAYTCTHGANCDTSVSTLYAVPIPGLQMDYPRGAILNYSQPWKNYVAMGDSFSSGEGVPAFESPSDTNGCHRSNAAYAKLLDGSPGARLQLQAYPSPGSGKPTTTFVACSGATTTDVINGKYDEPSQLDALSTSTNVVTITIGGNDIGFKEFATACVVGDCSGSAYTTVANKVANELPAKLDAAYAAVKAAINTSTTNVLVIGYPMMIPGADVVNGNLPYCAYLQDDYFAAQNLITALNQAVQAAVVRAGSAFRYVDPNTGTSPFQGHELCRNDSYFNGLSVPDTGFSLHPNNKGQGAFRQLIANYIDSNSI